MIKIVFSIFGVMLALIGPVRAAEQSTTVLPIVGPMNMTTLAGKANDAHRAMMSCSWGSSAPANGPSGAPIAYQCWADTTTNPVVFKRYDGASWVTEGKLNTSTHVWTPSYQGTDLGTASTATTGTSGHTLGFLDGTNTWSAVQSFNSGNLSLKGSSSGAGTLNAPAAASTFVWTLPAATDTLIGKSTTDALTNKTINGNTVTSGSGTLTLNAQTLSVNNGIVIATATANPTVTFQGSDTYVGRTTTDTLTNKTISAAVASGAWTASGTWTLPAFTAGGAITFADGSALSTAGLSNLLSLGITGGTLANGASALTITATQPASPVTAQTAIIETITSAGSASLVNVARSTTYSAGYTGSSQTVTGQFINAVAGTGNTLVPVGSNNIIGNLGVRANANASTTGLNVGNTGQASAGNLNVGLAGVSLAPKNGATNIGTMGGALNTGTTPVHVGGWFHLGQTTVPTANAALIADNAATSDPVARFRVAGVDKAVVQSDGGITVGAPTGGSKGSGTVNIDGAYYANGVAVSGTGTVTSVVAGTGLTGGTITGTGTIAVDYATKSDQQTGTSTAKTVNSAHQQDHPSAAKAWVYALNSTAIQSSYGVSSVTRASAGNYTINFTTAFTSSPSCSVTYVDAANTLVPLVGAASTGSVNIGFRTSAGVLTDPGSGLMVQCFGPQ